MARRLICRRHSRPPAARKRFGATIKKLPFAVPVSGHPVVDLNVPLQQPEGVYTVHVAVSRPSGYFRDKFFAGGAVTPCSSSAVSKLLCSVPCAVPTNGTERWTSVLEIDPTNPRWVERLPTWTQLRRIPGLNHGPLGSIRAVQLTCRRADSLSCRRRRRRRSRIGRRTHCQLKMRRSAPRTF